MGLQSTVKHVEAVSISIYGRFHGHALVTDPYSGEFPTFYNFLSDWLINLLAAISSLPAFWSQAVIFVPLLTTYCSSARIGRCARLVANGRWRY